MKETEGSRVEEEEEFPSGTEVEAEVDGVVVVVDNLGAGRSGDLLNPEQVDVETECRSDWKKSN